MPEQAAKEVQADAVLKEALQEAQIRNVRLWSIESRLRDEIDELKHSSLTPNHAQKASMLKSALTLVSGTRRDGEEEQKKFAMEMIVTPTDKAREAMKRAGMEVGGGGTDE